jgi:hypothetical protein
MAAHATMDAIIRVTVFYVRYLPWCYKQDKSRSQWPGNLRHELSSLA